MITVRDVFEVRFGQGKHAIAILRDAKPLLQNLGYPVERVLADVTGPFYTVVMESTFEDLAAFENALRSAGQDGEWQRLYDQFVPLVRSGRREVFRTVA